MRPACVIVADTNGKLPQEVLRLLKTGLGGHIKRNAFAYRETIDKERARIARIKELKARAVALVGSGLLAGLVGSANFASRLIYDAYSAM